MKNLLSLLLGVSMLGMIGVTAVNSQIVVGTQDFSITVEAANAPDPFSFLPVTVYAGETAQTDPVSLTGFTGTLPITVSGTGSPEYSLDNGVTFTSAEGVVSSGNTLVLRVSASGTAGQDRTGTVTIGGQSTTLTVTSSLTPSTTVLSLVSEQTRTNVPLSTWYESLFADRDLTVQLDDTPFSVSGGMEYKLRLVAPGDVASSEGNNLVGALAWQTGSQVLAAGSYELLVRSRSSDQYETTTVSSLTVGPLTRTVSLTTLYDPAQYTPDAFVIANATTTPDTVVTTDPVTVAGLGSGKTGRLSVSSAPSGRSAAFSVNGGVFSAASRDIQNGDEVRFRVTASPFDGGEVILTAQATTPGNVPTTASTWTVTAQGTTATTVDQFAFNWEYFPQTYFGSFPGSTSQTEIITLSGDAGQRTLRLLDSSGNYNGGSLNGWPALYGERIYFANTNTTITSSLTNDANRVTAAWIEDQYPNVVTDVGRQIRLKYTPDNDSDETYTILCVGYTCAEQIWTNSDTDPDPRAADPFDIADVTGASINTSYTSDPFTVSWAPRESGVQPPNIPISITGDGSPEYRIDGGAWTSASGWVGSGDTVEVRLTSATLVATSHTATLSVGTTTSDFVVRTQDDTTPDAFTLAAVTDVEPNTQVTSAAATITGITTAVSVSVSGQGSPELSTDSGVTWGTTGSVANDGTILVRLTSGVFEETRTATLDVNGVTDTFSVTTAAFSFTIAGQTGAATNQLVTSDPVPLPAGLPASAISITGDGSPQYSLDGGAFTSAAGTVSGGQTLEVRLTSAAVVAEERTATVTIGSATAEFSVITTDPCQTGPVGTTCVDGAIFAGVANGERIYINSSTQTSLAFMSGLTGYFPSIYDRGIDNQTFTLQAKGSLDSYPAMAHCAALSTGSRDFYLPTTSEMQVIYNNRASLSSALILSGVGDQYWTSTVFENGDYNRMGEFDMGSGSIDPDEIYSSTRSVICVSYGPGVTPIDPCAGSPSPGDYCADGTVYVGSLDGVARYTTVADTLGTHQLKTSNTATAGTSSLTDGIANTDAMIAAGDHPAAAACRGLGAEWYLPATTELNLMTLSAAPLLKASWASTGFYWSSTEFSSSRNYRLDPTSNTYGDISKTTTSYSVRCMTR